MNIQHAHCGLVAALTARSSPERPLPATGIPTRQAQGCVRVCFTASAWRRRRAANQLMRKYDETGNT